MNPTLTAIVFIVGLVFSAGFLALVFTLLPAIQQLRRVLIELESTTVEIRNLSAEFRQLAEKADAKVNEIDEIMAVTKRTMAGAGQALSFVNHNVLKRSAGLLAFLPALRLGWKMVKKMQK